MSVTFDDDLSIADYFLYERLREGLAGKTAIRFGDRSYSYGEVAERSRALARYLVAVGVAPEQRVYTVLFDVPPFAWATFGTLTAGAVVAMGNPVAPVDDLAYVLDYARAAAVITTPSVAESLASVLCSASGLRAVLLVPEVATGEDPEAPVAIPAALAEAPLEVLALREALERGRRLEVELPRCHRDDPCVWLFTSGSTGRPKAAVHTHRDFAFNSEVYAKRTIGYRQDDVTVSVPRLFFGYATGTNLWFPFAVGATTALFAERPTAESLVRAIENYRPTVVTNVPTMLGKLLDYDEERRARGEPAMDFSSIRFHLSAGEALPPALLARFLERFGGQVYDGIGSAEMFHIYCSNRPGDVRPGSLGRAVEGYSLAILPQDAEGPGAAELPAGETGVLWVKGDSVALGYARDRDRSWRTFHGHWCRTGDLFRKDADGALWFAGRADELFKVGGVWVAPLEVEDCLMQHEAVALAAVVAVSDGRGEGREGLQKPKAFVMLTASARRCFASDSARAALEAELQAHVRAHLSKHKYPRWIEFVDELPRSDRGKIDRNALRAQAEPAQ